jgi:hypothetical protein
MIVQRHGADPSCIVHSLSADKEFTAFCENLRFIAVSSGPAVGVRLETLAFSTHTLLKIHIKTILPQNPGSLQIIGVVGTSRSGFVDISAHITFLHYVT